MSRRLEAIARGETSAAEAQEIVGAELETAGAAAVYSALLRWTWRAISGRRTDLELRHFHRILHDTAFRVSRNGLDDSEPPQGYEMRLRGLADMLRVSVNMEDRPTGADLLTRPHVTPVLDLLEASPGRTLDQGRIAELLGLQLAAISGVLLLLELDGLVERTSWDTVRMTPAGSATRDARDGAEAAG